MAIAEHLVMNAMAHLRAGQRAEAAKLCRDIVRVEPGHARAHCLLGIIAFEDGDPQGALALLDRAGELDDRLPDVPRTLAEVHLALGNLEAALEAQRRATRMNPRQAPNHFKLAMLLERLDHPDRAEDACRRTLALDSGHVEARRLLAALLWRRGAVAEAEEIHRGARAAGDPGDPALHLAQILLARGQEEDLTVLAPATDPNQAFGERLGRAIGAWRRGDTTGCAALLSEAEDVLGQAGVEAPHRPLLLALRGWLRDLLVWRAAHPDAYRGEPAETLYVLGDLQVLAAAGLVARLGGRCCRLEARPVFGLRAAHLADDAGSPQAALFGLAADTVPRGAAVLAMLGEGDGRYKEGVMRTVHDRPETDPLAEAERVATGAVTALQQEACARGWRLALATPPMSNANLDLMPAAPRRLHLAIVGQLRESFVAAASSAGLPVIDLHGATREASGAARHHLFADSHHIRPQVLLDAVAAAG